MKHLRSALFPEVRLLHDERAHCTGAGRPGSREAGGRAGYRQWSQIMGETSHEHRVERTIIQRLGLIHVWEAADIHWAQVTLSSLPNVTAPHSP